MRYEEEGCQFKGFSIRKVPKIYESYRNGSQLSRLKMYENTVEYSEF